MAEPIVIRYAAPPGSAPPRRVRVSAGGWAGADRPMADGSEPQPWHCLPFVAGATYGLELVYPFEAECRVVRDGDTVRFDWDFAAEPGGGLTGGEFVAFAPRSASRFYMLNTRLDVVPPPGHVIRTEPHPRFFTDDSGAVPAAVVGHLENDWFPRRLFVVFKAPRSGEVHVFRKGEPFAQILAVPGRIAYELVPMPGEEEARRRALEADLDRAKTFVADNVWRNPDGSTFANHYKLLSRAFAAGGQPAVEQAIAAGVSRMEAALPAGANDALRAGAAAMARDDYVAGRAAFARALELAPSSAEAMSYLGICAAALGQVSAGLGLMVRATEVEPGSARWRANLGEMYRHLGRWADAEAAFRAALARGPADPGVGSLLGLVLAEQGRMEEAVEACRSAAAAGPGVAVVRARLGTVLAKAGRREEARATFLAALEVDPGLEEARRGVGG